jgi:valyl-tRNA synthetase
VLDTWFSSALWPHSTLGWPDDTKDMSYFYPTSVMETAYDILFFWVARMIMMGLENTSDIPFHSVYLHGLIRDEKGEKMSKTRGNVLDPLGFLERYGTDALRFALVTGTSPGNDSKLTTTKFEAGRNFANKLWNATRFVLRSAVNYDGDMSIERDELLLEDRWILSRLNSVITSVSSLLKDFQFGEAQRQVHDFLWGEYCDWYIELVKTRLSAESDAPLPQPVLVSVLEKSLRLLHPFMPFVTEELWQNIRNSLSGVGQPADSIMISAYPKAEKKAKDTQAERIINALVEIVRAIRNARAEHNVETSRLIDAQIYARELKSVISPYARVIQALAKAKTVFIDNKEEQETDNALVLVLGESEVIIPMASMVDLETERQRLQKEIAEMQAEVDRLEKMLDNNAFLTKAPPAVVNKEKVRLLSARDSLSRLQEHLKSF